MLKSRELTPKAIKIYNLTRKPKVRLFHVC
jgi:hypothetical protein